MSIQNRIFKEERYWELISGPWTRAEDWLMQQHIHDFNRSGIDCITEYGGDDNIFVYRCAKGYIYDKPLSNNPIAIKSRQNRMNDPERIRMYNRKAQAKYRESKRSELCEKLS